MSRVRMFEASLLALMLLAALAMPVAAARPADCTLTLEVPRTSAYGETVVLHVSGLTGIGGIDIFTSWRNRTEEAHLFLIPGITEFDFVYRAWGPPEEPPPPPLEPGTYRVHAVDATGCEATALFRVTR
jgi:hypothetical protein